VMLLLSAEKNTFIPEFVELLQRLADNVSFALENFDRADEKTKADERIEYLASHDGLTKLPNREMFKELLRHAIEAARRCQWRFALLFIDLDRFKVINDSLGHDAGDMLLPFLDSEVSTLLQESLAETGIDFMAAAGVHKVSEGPPFTLSLDYGGELKADAIVVAAGRIGNTEGLALENAGLATDPRGLLTVNENFQTAQPHIRAAGDVIGFPALASSSMEQARIAMVHAFDLKYKQQVTKLMPYGIYSIPECSMVGETEDSAQRKGVRYVVGRARYRDNARGGIIGDDAGFLKLIYRADDMQLIGAHMIGEQAIELIDIGLVAMQMNATFQTFIDACFNFPSLAELYKYATYDAMKRKQQGRVQGGSVPIEPDGIAWQPSTTSADCVGGTGAIETGIVDSGLG